MSTPTPAYRPSELFTWKIEDFSGLKVKRYSEIFYSGEYKWRLLVFPKGNKVDYLSVYLDVPDSATSPSGWSRYARYSISVVNQIHEESTETKSTEHQFNGQESDWGFTKFLPLSELTDPSSGFLVNDSIVIKAEVSTLESQDSKKEACFVGLKKDDIAEQERSEGESPHSQPTLQPTLCNPTMSVDAPPRDSTETIPPVSDTYTLPQAGSDTLSGQVDFLSYRVSLGASSVLGRIYDLHKDTFTKFSMASRFMQTGVLESLVTFVESISATKVNEVQGEALRLAADSVKDFELVGLDLSWLKQRLDEAKTVNEHSKSITSVEYYESAIQETRAKLCGLEEGLAKAKAVMEAMSKDLPVSLGADDPVLKGVL